MFCGDMSGIAWFFGLVIAACLAIFISSGSMRRFDWMFQDGVSNVTYVYVAGCISGVLLVPLTYALKRVAGYLFLSQDDGDYNLYKLDHGILNVDVPPASMWMNMGFWKVRWPIVC